MAAAVEIIYSRFENCPICNEQSKVHVSKFITNTEPECQVQYHCHTCDHYWKGVVLHYKESEQEGSAVQLSDDSVPIPANAKPEVIQRGQRTFIKRPPDKPATYHKLYNGKNWEMQVIHRQGEVLYVVEGVEYTSASTSARGVTGHPTSGRIFWGMDQ